jgi:RNase P/RNase MRP subunit POP5
LIKREKRRYLKLKIECDKPHDEAAVMDAVHASVKRLFGEYGASKANIRLIKGLPENGYLVVRCSHFMLQQVRAAVASTVEINGTEAAIHVLAVSGTIKALSKKV